MTDRASGTNPEKPGETMPEFETLVRAAQHLRTDAAKYPGPGSRLASRDRRIA